MCENHDHPTGVRYVHPKLRIIDVFADLTAPLEVKVLKSDATGRPLLTNGKLGVDMLYLPPGYAFPLHTHPGDHLLLIVQGTGTVTFDGETFDTSDGDLFMIEGGVPHAVGAKEGGQWLLAFGSPHKAVDAVDRMEVLDETR